MKLSLVAVVALFMPAAMFCQEYRGTITGSVVDQSGAMIAGAKIVVTQTQTNAKIETVSDSAGQYTAPFLSPGDYDISAKIAGFKEFVRKGVQLGSGDRL